MFCPNCGAQMEGSPKFCGVCGQPIGEGNNGADAMQPAPVQYQKAKVKSKTLLIGVAVAAIAILALVLIFSGGGSDEKGYTKLIDNYFSAVEKNNEKAVKALIPDDFIKFYEDNLGTDLTLDVVDNLYYSYGNKITSWEITSATEIKGDDLSVGLNALGIKESRVKGAYDLAIKVVFGGPDDFSTETVEISTINMDGKWSLIGVY
ncbi:MAG: hypothetical protein PHX37_02990 [Eubacteriales bacterium]|nr:hypothetical protein [Eubacteriales bacterium]